MLNEKYEIAQINLAIFFKINMKTFTTHFSGLGLAVGLMLITRTIGEAILTAGDVKVVGLFRIHETDNGNCAAKVKVSSVMASEAVKWYLDGLNAYGKLPFKIGFEGYNTCRQKDRAAELAIEVMNRSLAKEGIAGIIGPEFSSEAEVISPILSSVSSHNRLAQVGFSTTATRLSDEDQFPNIIRVVPDDDVQVEVMIQSMIQLEWNRVAIIHEDDTYGQEAASRLQIRTKEENICVSVIRTISVNDGVAVEEVKALLNDIIVGSGNRPSVSGIIYIGSSSTASSLFLTLNSAGFSTVPIVMLSEGVNMDTGVFRQFNGQVLSKAKGSLVFAPTYREVTEFTLHWKSIFTNKTYFEKESDTNPWLLDAFYEVKQCVERNCEFTELTDSEFNTAFGIQPLYIQYSILATHTLVKGIYMLHQDLCQPLDSCTFNATKLRAGDVLDKLKGININMANDFEWRLASLSDQELEMSVSTSGEISVPKDRPSYQLFNFQNSGDLATDFVLEKIGDFTDSKLSVDTNKMRDYDKDGGELVWPNVRKAQCSIQTKCAECIPIQDIQESFIYETGDIYVIAALPVFDQSGTDGCGNIRKVSGYQTVESVRFAIEKVNTKSGDFANTFTEMKVGVVVLNTCNNPVVIQRKIYDLHTKGIRLQNGTIVDLTNKIIGFVAELGSSGTIGGAEVLSRLRFVQTSFAATSPVLSDRSKYPYFARIVTPDDAQAKAMIAIIQKLKANYVQIVYSVGAYGEGGKDKIKEAAYENKVCVVQEIPVEETGNPNEIYDQLRRFSHAKIVIIFLRSHRLEEVMSALVSQISSRGEFVFIASEAWARRTDPLVKDDGKKLLGSYTLSIEMYQDNELRDHIRNLEPKPFSENPWSMTYLQTKRNCYYDFSFDKTMNEKCTSANDFRNDPNFELDAWDTPAFIATKSLLLGANTFLKDKCGTRATELCDEFTSNPTGLREEVLKTKLDLDGSGNKIKVFNDNGDGNIGYRIYNIQRDETLQNLVYVEVGRYPLEGTFTFEESKTVTPTEGEVVSRCPNEQACSGCFQQEEIESAPKKSEKSVDVGMVALGVLLAVAVITVIVLVVVIVRRRNAHQDANQTYLTPIPRSDSSGGTRQETIGSETFDKIPECGSGASVIQTTDT